MIPIAIFAPAGPAPGGGSDHLAGLRAAWLAGGHAVSEGGAGVPVVDGMALPGLEPRLDGLLARGAVALVHHLGAAAGRDGGARAAVRDAELRCLKRFRLVVASSAPVAERLRSEFGVAAPVVLHPGWAELPRSRGGRLVVSPGVMTPRKDQIGLLDALVRLLDLDWHLVLAGDMGRDAEYARAVAARADGLAGRVTVRDGGLSAAEWDEAGVFATATRWEGFPSGAAEALRRGVPVVGPRLPGLEAVVPAEAGVLCPPGDAATFGKCLRRVIFDRGLRHGLASGAWAAGRALPSWAEQAGRFAALLERQQATKRNTEG